MTRVKKSFFFPEMYFWIDADSFVSFYIGPPFMLSTARGHTGLLIVEEARKWCAYRDGSCVFSLMKR